MANDYVSVVYDDQRTPKTEYPQQMTKYLFDRFEMKPGERLLEIGCGRGDFLEAFAQQGLQCSGVDLSEYSVRSARGKDIKKCDVATETLPYDDATFDYVYHKSLIEHLYSPENLTKETFRVLKPGGRVIILTPDWVSQMKVFYEDFTHCRPYDASAVSDLLKVYGFSNIEAQKFYQLPVVWKYPALKSICWILQRFLSTPAARALSRVTKVKFFRWAVELMVLGTATK